MAIPPVISNLPIIKALRAGQAAPADNQSKTENTPSPSAPEDVVNISETAQQRLDGLKDLSLDKPDELADTIAEVRDLVEKHLVALGLDPDFT